MQQFQDAVALQERTKRLGWVDAVMVFGIAGLLYGLTDLAGEWTGPYRPSVEMDMSPWALPKYTFFSLSRGLIAYAFSLIFTLAYGYWAAKDRRAERVLVPLLDILQSIPVLGFMPGLVLALVALFPHSNTGLELAAIIMIFTGQVWNMTFSFYHSLRSVPNDLREVARVYRFGVWQRFRWVELPFATMGLVWNSMMSMAGGWFFLMINEAFQLGDHDFRLPGLGSYMSVAVERGDVRAMGLAVLAMIIMIVATDQLLWRPIVAWAQKFRVEDVRYEGTVTSWFLEWLRRSHLVRAGGQFLARARARTRPARAPRRALAPTTPATLVPPAEGLTGRSQLFSNILLALLVATLLWAAWRLILLLREVSLSNWLTLLTASGWTLARVLAATLIGTLWALPAGLAIGLSPRLSRILQPVAQVAASFPAPMLFPAVILVMNQIGLPLGWGSIVLMLLGTQWYILFNVIAGAMAMPADLKEAMVSYRVRGWQRFRVLYLPAIFSSLVTGWVTAAGGAWNASIVSEFVAFKGETLRTTGLGAQISDAAESADFPRLAASVLIMSLVVVGFNRTVWHRLYALAEQKFSLNK